MPILQLENKVLGIATSHFGWSNLMSDFNKTADQFQCEYLPLFVALEI